ncbi:MAG: ABC transporter ATP-binding protein [Polyangiaceae bacterium]
MTVVVATQVFARDALGPKGAPRGSVGGVSFTLDKGTFAILGTPEDGTLAFAAALSGQRRIDRGRLTVAGRDPAASAAARARIGYVALDPALPPARDVAGSIAIATSVTNSTKAALDALERLGGAALSRRTPTSLTAPEARTVELAIAVATPELSLLVVVEPFSDLAGASVAAVRGELDAVAARGAVLVVVTSSPHDASQFDRVYVLHRGAFVRASQAPHGELGLRAGLELALWVDTEARALAGALGKSAAVRSLTVDLTGADSPEKTQAAGGVLRVAGDDADALALAVADAVTATGAVLTGLTQGAPTLAELRAATELELKSRAIAATRATLLQAQTAARPQAAPYGAPVPPRPASPAVGGPQMVGPQMVGPQMVGPQMVGPQMVAPQTVAAPVAHIGPAPAFPPGPYGAPPEPTEQGQAAAVAPLPDEPAPSQPPPAKGEPS